MVLVVPRFSRAVTTTKNAQKICRPQDALFDKTAEIIIKLVIWVKYTQLLLTVDMLGSMLHPQS